MQRPLLIRQAGEWAISLPFFDGAAETKESRIVCVLAKGLPYSTA